MALNFTEIIAVEFLFRKLHYEYFLSEIKFLQNCLKLIFYNSYVESILELKIMNI